MGLWPEEHCRPGGSVFSALKWDSDLLQGCLNTETVFMVVLSDV